MYGYRVIATPAPIRHCGSVALFYRYSPVFLVEMIRQFGKNVITCQLDMGEKGWYIVGCYLEPGDGATIQDVEAKISEWMRGAELILAGDLNVDMERMGGQGRDKEIAVALVMVGLECILAHLLPRQRAWNQDQRTWAMERQGREVRYRMDYILGSN